LAKSVPAAPVLSSFFLSAPGRRRPLLPLPAAEQVGGEDRISSMLKERAPRNGTALPFAVGHRAAVPATPSRADRRRRFPALGSRSPSPTITPQATAAATAAAPRAAPALLRRVRPSPQLSAVARSARSTLAAAPALAADRLTLHGAPAAQPPASPPAGCCPRRRRDSDRTRFRAVARCPAGKAPEGTEGAAGAPQQKGHFGVTIQLDAKKEFDTIFRRNRSCLDVAWFCPHAPFVPRPQAPRLVLPVAPRQGLHHFLDGRETPHGQKARSVRSLLRKSGICPGSEVGTRHLKMDPRGFCKSARPPAQMATGPPSDASIPSSGPFLPASTPSLRGHA
jgi:hypothetical protein